MKRARAYEEYPCPVDRLYGFQRFPGPSRVHDGVTPPKLMPGENVGWVEHQRTVSEVTGEAEGIRVCPKYIAEDRGKEGIAGYQRELGY